MSSVAGRAREMAERIDRLADSFHELFANARPLQDRVARVRELTGEIEIGMLPVVSWAELRLPAETADLLKRRLYLVIDGARACARYDIPEWATIPPKAMPEGPSEGVNRAVVFGVSCKLVAAWVVDLALHIERDEKRADPPTRSKRPKVGDEKWRRAQEKMLGRLNKEILPKTLRDTAKAIEETYSTTRRAALKSPTLSAYFGLNSDAAESTPETGGLLDELAKQADHRTQRAIEDMTPGQRQEAESALRDMDPQQAPELVKTLASDPDSQKALRGLARLDADEQDPTSEDYIPKRARRRERQAGDRHEDE